MFSLFAYNSFSIVSWDQRLNLKEALGIKCHTKLNTYIQDAVRAMNGNKLRAKMFYPSFSSVTFLVVFNGDDNIGEEQNS